MSLETVWLHCEPRVSHKLRDRKLPCPQGSLTGFIWFKDGGCVLGDWASLLQMSLDLTNI
jgi:hypothetical protein